VPGQQNVVLYPFVNPSTELIDATNLPKADVTYDPNTGLPVSDVKITPISSATDGTQIWRITHNGVDTHPIHWHLYDVQVLNRVTWDNIILPPEAGELGWKDTLRISPLEDTIVALRPIIPEVPWELPNAIRNLNPMMPAGSTAMFNNVDPQGNPTAPIVNQLVNYGWEYMYHCHILSHEEMDMMRPVSVASPPIVPDGLAFDKPTGTLTWNDNSIAETSTVVQRSTDGGASWADIGTIPSPLDQPNTTGLRSFTDPAYDPYTDYQYGVVAKNEVGYGLEFPSLTVQSVSDPLIVVNPPAAPTNLAAVLAFGPQITLTWTDHATNETGFVVERATNGGAFAPIGTVGANVVTYVDNTGQPATTYDYRVMAVNAAGNSPYSNVVQVVLPAAPAAPTNLTLTLLANPTRVRLTWQDNATNETAFVIERSTDGVNFAQIFTLGPRAGTGIVTWVDTTVQLGFTYTYRVAARNLFVKSAYSTSAPVAVALPAQPSILTLTAVRQGLNTERVTVTWTPITGVTAYTVQWSVTNWGPVAGSANVQPNLTTYTTGNIARQLWWFRVGATNVLGTTWSTPVSVLAAP
jgi:hypothetical protein